MGDLVARMADTQKETGDALPLNSAGGSQVKRKWDSLGNQSVLKYFRKKSEGKTNVHRRAHSFIIHHEKMRVKGNSRILWK